MEMRARGVCDARTKEQLGPRRQTARAARVASGVTVDSSIHAGDGIRQVRPITTVVAVALSEPPRRWACARDGLEECRAARKECAARRLSTAKHIPERV